MVRTAGPSRVVHLEQRMANDGRLAALARKAREEMAEPSRSYRGGHRSAQGRARSSWAASLNRVASSPNLPRKWLPIGRPSPFRESGTDMPGCPVTLPTKVNGANPAVLRLCAIGSPPP